MLDDALVVLDFETTGLSPGLGDRITEVAAVRIHDGKIVDRYESLVNCGVRIPSSITSYTGITQRMVDRAPLVTTVVRELMAFTGQTPIVAHNASFDQRFLDNECRIAGFGKEVADFVCSMKIARRVFPGFRSHALGSLADQLAISFSGSAHRAGADAEVTANLMLRIARELKLKHAHLSINVPLLRKIMKMPIASASVRLQRMT